VILADRFSLRDDPQPYGWVDATAVTVLLRLPRFNGPTGGVDREAGSSEAARKRPNRSMIHRPHIYMTYSFLRKFFGQEFRPGIAVDLLQCFSANCVHADATAAYHLPIPRRDCRGRVREDRGRGSGGK
jgi:hypothetical protein